MVTQHPAKIRVLFLCTGNSCRSQMAKGWARYLKAGIIDAYSAGVSPGYINPRAVEVMAEVGVDISEHRPKHVDELAGIDFDYVITLCDNAREQCPVFPKHTRLIHRGFADPSFVDGAEQQVLTAFRQTREQIKAFVERMPEVLTSKG